MKGHRDRQTEQGGGKRRHETIFNETQNEEVSLL